MPVELFEIRKQFIIGAFLLILTQEETGSKDKLLTSLGSLIINSTCVTEIRSAFGEIF